MIPSPLLRWPGAVPGEGEAAGVAAFYTNPYVEQRELEAGRGFVDLSHWRVLRGEHGAPHAREVLECDAAGRILSALLRCPGSGADIFLSPPGGPDCGMCPANYIAIGTTTQGAARLRAAMQGQAGLSAISWEDWWPGSDRVILLVEDIEVLARAGQAAGMSPVGLFAWTAYRVAARRPDPFRAARARARLADIYGPAVVTHGGIVERGEISTECGAAGTASERRGAERSLACLYLEGPDEADLPEAGTPVLAERSDEAVVGFVTSTVRHWEEGPLALALIREPTALGAVRVAEFRCGVEPIPLPAHVPVAVTIRESGEKSVVGRD
ncbi:MULTISPECIES: hypothetical protein [Actinotignum]|uniref:Aminomethyltransferase folate-binding domain-containing protein n=2 Tax=Actinomycetaceae TaxID=2049 RepID=A0ABU5GEK3_9ACTO|nr:hypothetical protein [Actinotignum timonense]MDK6418980.1 hypothetical protein [Actinotignum timonense]MDK6645155.1 hypothetical protein [Actinotignum timonense]MDK6780662.1 hypothetical protein [Actinotignum timonense]MDK8358569.1 hypothetical protein [Actinotignum timonense]MDK8781593.1 hypothetical protein [Actinotignum timonense]